MGKLAQCTGERGDERWEKRKTKQGDRKGCTRGGGAAAEETLVSIARLAEGDETRGAVANGAEPEADPAPEAPEAADGEEPAEEPVEDSED